MKLKNLSDIFNEIRNERNLQSAMKLKKLSDKFNKILINEICGQRWNWKSQVINSTNSSQIMDKIAMKSNKPSDKSNGIQNERNSWSAMKLKKPSDKFKEIRNERNSWSTRESKWWIKAKRQTARQIKWIWNLGWARNGIRDRWGNQNEMKNSGRKSAMKSKKPAEKLQSTSKRNSECDQNGKIANSNPVIGGICDLNVKMLNPGPGKGKISAAKRKRMRQSEPKH